MYFGANLATAHQLYTTFWKCVDLLGDMNVAVDYVMTDDASTNRSFATMLFPQTSQNSNWIFRDIYFKEHGTFKMSCTSYKIRDNLEASKIQNKTSTGRYLVQHGKCHKMKLCHSVN